MFSYNFFLAKKFAGRRKGDNFLWFISVFSIAGVAIGVIALMLVIGVMNGFSKELKRKIIGAHPTITIEGKPYIFDYGKVIEKVKKDVREVEGISPYISTQVIYRSDRYLIGGLLRGIDPESEEGVTNLGNFVKHGNYKELKDGIILGSELARELGVGVGDRVSVIAGLSPSQISTKVAGIVEYGVYAFDSSMGFVSLDNIMKFLKVGNIVHGIGIRTENIYDSGKVAQKIRSSLENRYNVTTWIQKNKILFAALALEKKAMSFILGLIVLVASFNISATLMITVYRKVKEIGILRALGLSSAEIKKIFIYQGLLIGLKGLVIGLVTGGILAMLLRKYQFVKLPEFVYDLSRLPIEISVLDLTWISGMVIAIVCIASVYPAQRAARLNPNQAIRNE
ncbi:MAG TPA: ABC transporter permease [bacterium]|nr:ABC transporter permease [bacterium]